MSSDKQDDPVSGLTVNDLADPQVWRRCMMLPPYGNAGPIVRLHDPLPAIKESERVAWQRSRDLAAQVKADIERHKAREAKAQAEQLLEQFKNPVQQYLQHMVRPVPPHSNRDDFLPDRTEALRQLREEFEQHRKQVKELTHTTELSTEGLKRLRDSVPQQTILPTFQGRAVGTAIASVTAGTAAFIEGVAVDTTVNRNNWAVRQQDLPLIAQELKGKQLRLGHSNSPRDVVGIVTETWVLGNAVGFKAQLDDEEIADKLRKGFLGDVSIQVLGDFVCSKCGKAARHKEQGNAVHLCEGAYELVLNPQPLELSIVNTADYTSTKVTKIAG